MMSGQIIEHKTFDQERALYGSHGLTVRHCAFDGPADGESAVKECGDITAEDCFFNLRYPFWHVQGLTIRRSELTGLCRAALWYSDHISIEDTKLHGIKALRECDHIVLKSCDILSPEFGWSARDVRMEDSTAESEYFFMRGERLDFRGVNFKGKYSFQYVKGGAFDHCSFDTKDAFWHSENVTVTDSVVKGEYLAWYSENLTLVRCKIVGTQPLCYCKGLKLIDCEMVDTDLAFERSEVEATVTTPIVSVKNPRAGTITAPAVGELIMDDPEARGEVILQQLIITGKGA
ncbi:hypothetical protein CE91St41_24100 [Oscillospiraceae bacterium]|nr:hypothetical protein CE91St40_13440 [Oscillospiraceae bacterium]BDF75521.1 hypothetical protein CE91St41_24100 [Oscillospiraceae bacterium]